MSIGIGSRVRVGELPSVCEYVWGHEGVVVSERMGLIDGHQFLVKFDMPIISPAAGWPALDCLFLSGNQLVNTQEAK